MIYKIDENIIKSFRNKVNDNENFVYATYKNVNRKNHWNLICSCMDWIDVAVSYLQEYHFDKHKINLMSMQVYTYISSIDIIFESIIQLHRAIIKNDNIPFKGINKIFKNNNICKDDNSYFKQIRAAFGAHPVNLDDNNGKWFASWPSDYSFGNEHDFQIILYSSIIEKDDIVFGLRFDELNHFLQERYAYLNVLSNEIELQFEKFKNQLINQPIEHSLDIIQQLEILRIVSSQRLNNDYYRSTIEELITIYNHELKSQKHKELFNDYKDRLKKIVTEITNNLQIMKFKDFEYDSILNPDYPAELLYSITKLYSCGFNSYKDPLFSFFLENLNDYSSGKYGFQIDDSPDELLIKLKLMLFYK